MHLSRQTGWFICVTYLLLVAVVVVVGEVELVLVSVVVGLVLQAKTRGSAFCLRYFGARKQFS